MEFLVRVDGMVEDILTELLEAGYYKTKAELVRAAVLGLGERYHFLDELHSDLAYAREMDRRIKSGEIKLGTEAELMKLIRKKKRE